jgi:uncharacterized protein
MIGMNRHTGAVLDGHGHLTQSLGDIINTPVGTRLMRREYGSHVPDLIDAPANAATRVQLYAATATAVMRWERRISLERVTLTAVDAKAGRFLVNLTSTVRDTGRPATFKVPLETPVRAV